MPKITFNNLNPTTKPPKRKGHSVCECNGKMYIFGGNDGGSPYVTFNDLWEYTPSTNTWVNKNPTNPPDKKNFYCKAMVSYNNEIYMFGGNTYNKTTNSSMGMSNDLWKYSTTTNTWTLLSPLGTKPNGRYQFGMTIYDDNIYIYGGAVTGNLYNNDLWKYNITNNTWYLLSPSFNPPKAYGNFITAKNNKIFQFGGRIDDTGTAYNDIYEYDILTNNWSLLTPTIKPPEAVSANMYSYGNNLYIFYTGKNPYYLEVWAYSIIRNAWYKIENIVNAIDILSSCGMALINSKFYSFSERNLALVIQDYTYSIEINNKAHLIKQSDNYYSIKTEFYDVGTYKPLTLEGGITPNDNDFINNGIEDLNELLSTRNNAMVDGVISELGSGNMFSFDIKNDFKSIINIE